MADTTSAAPLEPAEMPRERLDSWKEIAAHLRRDVSTVRRWEKSEALPVHRHVHAKLGSVYAYTSELDAWWESRGQQLGQQKARERPATTPYVRTAALLLLVVAIGVSSYTWMSKGSTNVGSVGAVRSLAVLPFQPLVADARDESLEFGMADALITKLSGIRQLAIRPMESVRNYAGSGQDLQVAGRELRVDALLVGSVQRAGDRVRLSVRLIGARDGRVLWAETFDEQWTHIFALQDAVSNQVARALSLRLTSADRERLSARDTDNPAAYREYLMGRHFWNQRTAAGFKTGLQHFERAVALDPSYALAHVGVAESYTGSPLTGCFHHSKRTPEREPPLPRHSNSCLGSLRRMHRWHS